MALKSFQTLIKLQKSLVDEQRQQVAKLQDHLEQIEGAIVQMQIALTKEQQAAHNDPMVRQTLGAYLKRMVAQQKVMEGERRTASLAVRQAQAKLVQLFEELKRYEVAEEQRLDAIAKEEARQETKQLDEIGAIMHERRTRENDK